MDPVITLPRPPSDDARERGWEGRIARGFRLARVSWEVLATDRRLLLLPLLAGLGALAALAVIASLARGIHAGPEALRVVAPVWAAAYAISFVTIFCNVALVHVVSRRWHGEHVTLRAGLRAARGRAAAIAGWAAFATTAGIALRLVERLTLGISRFAIDVAWSVASFFVVPVLVLERRGPAQSLRRSAQIVRREWAEGLGGATPIALATLMVLLPAGVLLAIGIVLYVMGLTIPGVLAIAAAGAFGGLVWIVSVGLSQVFTLAVYQHATHGPCFDGFPADDLERPRGRS
jgi:hypothetical protein